MKTIEQLPIPKQVDSDFPFGAIINETDTEQGTPVVREIYNDILVNLYKLLDLANITPTGNEDSESTQYQIVQALKLLPNDLNDIEKVLSLNSGVWEVAMDLSILPNKYVFIARAADAYVNGSVYTFKGSGATAYPFSSAGFSASDELIVIVDVSGVRAYSLSFLSAVSNEVFTVMGSPVAFNNSNKMYYQEDGNLISDVPSVDYLENIIRVDVSDGTVLVTDILVLNGYVLCMCVYPNTNTYFFRQFAIADLSASFTVALVGTSFDNTSDFSPYIYAEQGAIYITNDMNSSANDYVISRLNYNPALGQLSLVSSFSLDNTFVKTTSGVIKSGLLYTLVNGQLNTFNLATGVKVTLGNYNSVIGTLFGFNGGVYFTSGEVSKKWF